MGKLIDLTGQRFGKLVVVRKSEERSKIDNNIQWDCLCDCGKIIKVITYSLTSGHTKSCGCIKLKHGRYNTKEYESWISMKSRCINKRDMAYNRYGGAGIIVCDRWINSFENFYKDMGCRPEGMTLDRIDNKGNYELENCKWSTPYEQARNRKSTIYVTLHNKRECILDLCNSLNIDNGTVYVRLKNGWSIACALWLPRLPNRKDTGNFSKRKRVLNALKY
jgi:hypothetical protein